MIVYDLVSITTPHLQAIIDRAGNGALLRGYTSPRPARGAAITTQTLLFEETCGTPFGVIDGSGEVIDLTDPTPANALVTGTWNWWRVVKADGTTFVMDGDASDFSLSGTGTEAGQPVTLTNCTITAGNVG